MAILVVGAMLSIVGTTGCHRERHDPVVVNVLRVAKSKSFEVTEHNLLQFQSHQPTTFSGRPIVVQSILMDRRRFEETLADERLLSTMKPDIVVLDSPDEANASSSIKRLAATARNACGGETICPGFIADWRSDEQMDASQQVLKALVPGG